LTGVFIIAKEKVYVRGMVNKDVFDEFIRIAANEYNFKKGFMGIHLEHAMRLYNGFYKVVGNESFKKICLRHNVSPWELAEHLITFDLLTYKFTDDNLKEKLVYPLLKWDGEYREDLVLEFCENLEPFLKKR